MSPTRKLALVIDDDRESRHELRSIIEDTGMHVEFAGTLVNTLRDLHHRKYDLIVVNLDTTFVDRIQDKILRSNTPVISITKVSGTSPISDPANHFLRPFRNESLQFRISVVVRK
jgi:CheY-like chemotaxis protein